MVEVKNITLKKKPNKIIKITKNSDDLKKNNNNNYKNEDKNKYSE